MHESPLNPVEALKDYGLSTTTIARIAQVKLPVMRSWSLDRVPEGSPALIRLSGAVSLLDTLNKISTLPVDAATFYEEQLVIVEKDGETFYCPAYHLYESGTWSQEEFVKYAKSTAFYSRNDFAEQFPLVTRVVDAPDGYKAIVCEYPIPRVNMRDASSLADYTIIK
jgi:hypothetical protein